MTDHRHIDARSLTFGRAIAERLRARPDLVRHALANIHRWFPSSSARVQPTLLEWEAALNGPLKGVISFLTSPDERSTRLRQSNPFTGVLAEEERLAILRDFESRYSTKA